MTHSTNDIELGKKGRNMSKDYIIPTHIEEILRKHNLSELLNVLNEPNKEIVSALIVETIKLSYFRQLHKGNKALNSKEITHLLNLSFFHQSKKTEFIVPLSSPLRALFGIPEESKAEEWFIDKIISRGKICDIYNREIIIKDELDCYYKDAITQKHIVATENYKLERAKRLPWIPLTIEKTKEIYRLEKPNFKCEEFYYVGTFKVELMQDILEGETKPKYHMNYYIVGTRRKYKLNEIQLITTYPIFNYLDLLRYIERWEPFYGETKNA